MSRHHLAQLNIARPLAPLDSPLLAEFVGSLDRINALAERSPGFVWRLQSDAGNATDFTIFDDITMPNLTVWESVESLHAFVYRSAHVEVMRKRRQWFEKMAEAVTVLWWIPAGHTPTIGEAAAKLELLREAGPSPAAFTFRHPFPPPATPDSPLVGAPAPLDDSCPA